MNKRRFWDRHDHLHHSYGEQDPVLIEPAAGSEDAFDAAFSALTMANHLDELARLRATSSPHVRLEGWVWAPEHLAPPAP